MSKKSKKPLSPAEAQLLKEEKETILKIEHFAEGLVTEFFQIFLEGNHKIKAFDAYKSLKDPIDFQSSLLKNKDGKKSVAESQFKLRENFDVSTEWLEILKAKDSNVVIDDISCFDCVIIKGDKTLVPVEVKSGYSDAYKTLKDVLKKSFHKKHLKLNKKTLLGDLISILGSARPQSKGDLNDLIFEKKKLLKPKYHKLSNEWILVIRNRKQLEKEFNFKFEGAGLRYILTLEDIVEFLQTNGKNIIPKEKVLKNSNLSSFETKILKDFRFWLNHKTIKTK